MDAINLGPLAIPVRVLAPFAGVIAANLITLWWRRRRGVDADPSLWHMLAWGFLAARAAFVLKHFDAYSEQPLSMLDIRDGGFVAFAGLLVAFAIGFEQVRRHPPLRRPLLASALAGIVVWAGAVLAASAAGQPAAPLPAVALKRLDGSSVTLPQLAGKPMVVNLWATWCPPCRREMPVLAAAQAANPDVTFVFVNQAEQAAVVKGYLETERLTLANVVLDPISSFARATNVKGYPTTLFYDGRGKLAARHMGELSQAQLSERLEALR